MFTINNHECNKVIGPNVFCLFAEEIEVGDMQWSEPQKSQRTVKNVGDSLYSVYIIQWRLSGWTEK